MNEVSRDCPIATVLPQFYEKGRTTDGTAPLRLSTFVGSDGQIINIQEALTLCKRSRLRSGMDGTMATEEVGPNDAMKWIRREAGITP